MGLLLLKHAVDKIEVDMVGLFLKILNNERDIILLRIVL